MARKTMGILDSWICRIVILQTFGTQPTSPTRELTPQWKSLEVLFDAEFQGLPDEIPIVITTDGQELNWSGVDALQEKDTGAVLAIGGR